MLNIGDLIYFKNCKNLPDSKATEFGNFEGHGVGIFLGQLKPFVSGLTQVVVYKLLSSIGFIAIDDVAEFLSREQAQVCITKLEAKYFTRNNPQIVDTEGKIIPIITKAEIKKQIQSMTPEQIKQSIDNAKKTTSINLKRDLTEDEVKNIQSKVCAALGVDPETYTRPESAN